MKIVRMIAGGLVAFAAALLLAIELAGSLPSPVLPLLALSVTIPEVAPFGLAAAVVVALAAWALAHGRARRFAVGCAALAALLALVPIVEFPFARAAAFAELGGVPGFGDARANGEKQRQAAGAFTVLANRPVRLRDGTMLALDVYRPTAGGARPTIVTIYGGAWIFGKRADTRQIDEAYAARGYTVIAIDYRHAPKFLFPTQIDDVRDALAAIATNAIAWHVDRDRVALFGRSAGAELALLAGYEPEPVHVRAVVGYYSPTDLIVGYESPPWPDPANVRSILSAYLGGPPVGARRAAYRAASPLAHVRPGLPPTLLIVGLRDALITNDMQRALRDALRAHGDRVVAIELPWSNHVFDEIPGGLGTRIAAPITRDFLASLLVESDKDGPPDER